MSTLFYLEKGCASIENAEKFSKKCGFYGLRPLGSRCGLEGGPFLRGLSQIDGSGLKFAELVENGAQIADLIGQLIGPAALDVMKELDGTGLLEHIRVIDVEKEYDMTLWYDDRYEIKLGGTDEMAYKIRYLCSILDQLSEFQAGTIDLTQATQKRATFQPAA